MSRYIIHFPTFVFGPLMQLFVGTNVVLGSKVTQEFVIGMHSAFWVSLALGLVGIAFSLIRGKENRRQTATGAAGGE